MAFLLPADKCTQMKVTYVDAKGNEAQVDSVQWSASDDAILRITVDGQDPTKAMLYPVGQTGTAQVVVTADADLGEGTTELITTGNVEVVAGQAVSGTIEPVGDLIEMPSK